MIGMIGIAVIFIMVFGGYTAAGGKLEIILKALPFELAMIGGAAVGAFLISNGMAGVKQTMRDIGKVFRGPRWKPEDYRDLLCLLFELVCQVDRVIGGVVDHDNRLLSAEVQLSHDGVDLC